MSYQKFIETLIAQQSLRESDLNKVNKIQQQMQETGLPLLLIKLGLCSEKDVAQALATVSGLSVLTPADYPDTPVLPDDISLRFLKEFHLVGILAEENKLIVAVLDPENSFIKQSLSLKCELPIELKIGLLSDIDKAIERQYGGGKSQMGQITDNLDASESLDDIEHLKDLASEAPVIRMVNLVFQRALESKASDIHFEPFENALIIRLRIDGVLQQIEGHSASATPAIISRIKLMAKLNIAERRLPQDGRIKIQMQGKEIDLRVSTSPTMYGESVVIRLLDKENIVFDFASLGFEAANQQQFIQVLNKPHGIILITGPTGSGKSTTLYTALS
ncbi:MAG: ATPase, T2SS/T4P/T4SS family, partial [Methyloprofundus sp.]|nr:ATPase, T2SS/T4P/T4SS family [Methyloprofundus sp.]